MVVQTELYVANRQHCFPVRDMHIFKHIADTAYHKRTSCLGTIDGELAALADTGWLPQSYDKFIQRGLGRYELPLIEECRQAARDTPGALDCILNPSGELLSWMEQTIGEDPDLREVSAFVARPKAPDQDEHLDNASAVVRDYITLFWAVENVTKMAGGTRFYRNTAALSPVERDALCVQLKKERGKNRDLVINSSKGETVRLGPGQWLTFGLYTVHHGLANASFEHARIIGSALWARKGAADLPENRVLVPLPERSARQTRVNREVISLVVALCYVSCDVS